MTRDIYSARKLSINLQAITEIENNLGCYAGHISTVHCFSPEQSIN